AFWPWGVSCSAAGSGDFSRSEAAHLSLRAEPFDFALRPAVRPAHCGAQGGAQDRPQDEAWRTGARGSRHYEHFSDKL
ncbi:MAG: hypothetical protein ACE5NP_10540, partial [Anaerolineae bacterium]